MGSEMCIRDRSADQAGSAAVPEPLLVTQSEASPPERSGQNAPPAAAAIQEPGKAAVAVSETPDQAPKMAPVAPVPTPPEAKPEALGVEILNVRWHPSPGRRSVRVQIDGSGPYDLNEGDTVAGVSIIRIAPASIEVQVGARSRTLRMGE